MNRKWIAWVAFSILGQGFLPFRLGAEVPFVRGDPNGDSEIDISDPVRILFAFFVGPQLPCAKAGDADDSGKVNLLDVVLLLNFLFRDGLAPPSPYPGCGFDLPGHGLSCGSFPPCGGDFKLQWPVPGEDARDWVINNYVDLDPDVNEMMDYSGSTVCPAKTYDGHRGIDIDVPTFRAMDANFPILAAADGEVGGIIDGNFDRNVSCTSYDWNAVLLRHANGFKSIYGHMKNGSVEATVSLGQEVNAAEGLGVVGSSGCSTAPHLHFELHDGNGQVVDPFLMGLWVNPPVYDTPLGLMDLCLTRGGIQGDSQIKDPPPNIATIEAGEVLGIGLSVAGGARGDEIKISLLDGNGSLYKEESYRFDFCGRHSFKWWNEMISCVPGSWTVEVRMKGILVRSVSFQVDLAAPPDQIIRYGIPEADYQGVVTSITADDQYRLVWVDGYDVQHATCFNAVFERKNGVVSASHHGLKKDEIQKKFNDYAAVGGRLVCLDSYLSYLSGGEIRYAAIFVKETGTPQEAYFGVSRSDHLIQYNSLKSSGYRPVNIPVVVYGGTESLSAFYDKANVGYWEAWFDMDSADYQARFISLAGQGMVLGFLNGYSGGGPKFSAIWNSLSSPPCIGRHSLKGAQLQAELDCHRLEGMRLRILTGYENNGVANFGAFWTRG